MRAIVPLAVALLSSPLIAQPTWMDVTFGDHGVVITSVSPGPYDRGNTVVIQPDGRTVVAGTRNNNADGTRMVVLRYTENGQLDDSFSGNGSASPDVGDKSIGQVLLLQSDGKIVIGGSANFPGSFDDLMLVRYNADGTLDDGFAGDGVLTVVHATPRDEVLSIVQRTDNSLLTCGLMGGLSSDMFAWAVSPEGENDDSFAGDGEFQSALNTGEIAVEVLVRSDGRIALVGATSLDQAHGDLAVLQLMPNGSADDTFGEEGLFRSFDTVYVDYANSAVLRADDHIVIGAERYFPGGSHRLYLTCITPDGVLDQNFGQEGSLDIPVDIGIVGALKDVVITPDDKIVTACLLSDTLNATDELLFVRTDLNGVLDASFGTNGFLYLPCPGAPTCSVEALAAWPDGRITAVGHVGNADTSDILVMRLLPSMSDGTAEITHDGPMINAWPNPANDQLQVTWPADMRAQRIALLDATGRTIANWPLNNTFATSMSTLALNEAIASGSYLLQVTGNAGIAVQRVTIQR